MRLAAAAPGRTLFVGVDGCGASGKSTLAARMAAAVPGLAVVAVDDFADPAAPEWDHARFEAELAAPLRAGRPARYRVGDWRRGAVGPWLTVEPGVPVVVEGVSATRREVALPWSLRIWVDAPRGVRLARARARDGEDMLVQWQRHWMPSEDAYVRREDPVARADLVVDATVPMSGTLEGP